MYFVNKDDIAFYRYAVAKECFLRLYPEYVLVKDIPKSNCIWMRMKKAKEELIVSLFSTPSEKQKGMKKNKIVCFYQAKHYKRAKQKYENGSFTVLKLSKEFDEEYDSAFEHAIRYPQKYQESIGTNQFLFDNILLKHKNADGYTRKWYKYYSEEKVRSNRYGVVDGQISFADPKTFNDPFDVNCFFANDEDMSGLFRIFCVAPTPKEILMWSYYSSDHKGYCFEYNERDILNQILDTRIDGLCIIGNVEYTKSRPKQKSKLNAISFTEISFYIQAAFTKFDEWGHEKEYRYVMLSVFFDNPSSQYHTVKIPVYDIYCGLRGDDSPIEDSAGNNVVPIKVSKDLFEYKLI